MSDLFLAMTLEETVTIMVMGRERELKLDYIEGLVGMLPVFSTEEFAIKYSDSEVLKIKFKEKKAWLDLF